MPCHANPEARARAQRPLGGLACCRWLPLQRVYSDGRAVGDMGGGGGVGARVPCMEACLLRGRGAFVGCCACVRACMRACMGVWSVGWWGEKSGFGGAVVEEGVAVKGVWRMVSGLDGRQVWLRLACLLLLAVEEVGSSGETSGWVAGCAGWRPSSWLVLSVRLHMYIETVALSETMFLIGDRILNARTLVTELEIHDLLTHSLKLCLSPQ
ncbi:hypothetical protein BDY21DRAFT_355877 [Lineolata rhizophorae]|uniref:Uncharacterized protein n=1 Tax=Lineolata rhizophorae TaxID=578093 RepID=A0A6A6NPX8_9PEZI|nr:hypothetical protein BDY21DRAFT_355877 [Lineolata rhizophorae]